jgi:S1-C subfamily serine protease
MLEETAMFALPLLLVLPAQLDIAPSKNFTKDQQTRALLATVRVVNEGDQAEGTGVIIHQRETFVYVLTAAHLVGKAEAVQTHLFSSKSYPKPEKVIKRAEVVARAKSSDVALLRFELREQVAVVPLCAPESIPKEKDFPALVTACAQGAPTLAEDVVRGQKLVRKPNAREATLMWEVDSQPPKGRSGGPLIDRHGYVLGVCSGTGGQKGYYVHIDEVRAFLRTTDYRWLLEDKEK